MNNMGLERLIRLVPGKKYHVQIIVDDTIATLYVDGVALNTRMYTNPGKESAWELQMEVRYLRIRVLHICKRESGRRTVFGAAALILSRSYQNTSRDITCRTVTIF